MFHSQEYFDFFLYLSGSLTVTLKVDVLGRKIKKYYEDCHIAPKFEHKFF